MVFVEVHGRVGGLAVRQGQKRHVADRFLDLAAQNRIAFVRPDLHPEFLDARHVRVRFALGHGQGSKSAR